MYSDQYRRFNGFDRQQPLISIQDSIQIALDHVSGQAVKAELETENGRLLYEVTVITPQGIEYQVDVDAYTGNVLNIEPD
jgi:uncharacterized membrane protein YkoI